jgi:GAF domain-containing protein
MTRADRCVAILKSNSAAAVYVVTGQPLTRNTDPLLPIRNECLSMGKVVDCEDVRSDKRLNADACRRVGISAVVIAPVMLDGRPMGAIEMHSSQLHNFMQSELEIMQRVAEAIGALICLK